MKFTFNRCIIYFPKTWSWLFVPKHGIYQLGFIIILTLPKKER